MEIIWIRFVPALLLLFYPLDDFLRGKIRLRDYEAIRNDSMGAFTGWLRQPSAWLDPVRAFFGAWLLRHAWVMEADAAVPGLWFHLPLFGTLLILTLALGVQMHTRRDTEALFAPLGYTGGIVFVLLPPEVAVLVIALAGVCLMAFRHWGAFFFFGALGSGVIGYMVLRVDYWMVASVILMIEPLMISLLVRRELLLPMHHVQAGYSVLR